MYSLLKPTISLGLSVESVLESGKSAIDSGGAFSYLSDKIDQFGGGAVHVTYKSGVYIGLILFMLAGIGLMLADMSNRKEAKSKIFWVGLGFAVVAGATMIIVFVADFTSGFGTELT